MVANLPQPLESFTTSGTIDRTGGSDVTSVLNSALMAAAAAGCFDVFISSGTYYINGNVEVPAGMRLRGMQEAILDQHGQFGCTLDAMNIDDVIIEDLSFHNSYGLHYSTGTARGDGAYGLNCGIYSSGNRVKIRRCKFDGFVVAVNLMAYNGSDNVTGISDCEVIDCFIENCSQGLLVKGHDNTVIRGLKVRDVTPVPGSPDPPHAIYFTGSSSFRSNTALIADTLVTNAGNNAAIQVKYTDGLVVSGLQTRTSAALNLIGVTQAVISAVQARDAYDQGGPGVISFQAVAGDLQSYCYDVVLEGVNLEVRSDASRAVQLYGSNVGGRAIYIQMNRPAGSSASDIALAGPNFDVEATVNNKGAGSGRAVAVNVLPDMGTDSGRIALRANRANLAVIFGGAASNTRIEIDPALLSTNSSAFDLGASTGTSVARKEREVILAPTGANYVVPSPFKATRTVVQPPNNAAYAVNSPATTSASGVPVGTTIEVLVINALSSGSLSLSWDAVYKFKGGSPATPSSGANALFRLRYDGSNWVEI